MRLSNGERELLLRSILASSFFPTLVRVMGCLIQLASNDLACLVRFDNGFVSRLSQLSGSRISLTVSLFRRLLRSARQQGANQRQIQRN